MHNPLLQRHGTLHSLLSTISQQPNTILSTGRDRSINVNVNPNAIAIKEQRIKNKIKKRLYERNELQKRKMAHFILIYMNHLTISAAQSIQKGKKNKKEEKRSVEGMLPQSWSFMLLYAVWHANVQFRADHHKMFHLLDVGIFCALNSK